MTQWEHFPTVCKTLRFDSQLLPQDNSLFRNLANLLIVTDPPGLKQMRTRGYSRDSCPPTFIQMFGTMETGIGRVSLGQFRKLILKDVSPWIQKTGCHRSSRAAFRVPRGDSGTKEEMHWFPDLLQLVPNQPSLPRVLLPVLALPLYKCYPKPHYNSSIQAMKISGH